MAHNDYWRVLVKGLIVFIAVAATVLVFSSAAYANSVTCAHGGNCSSGNLGGGTPTSSGGTLPFTGTNLAAIAGVAGLLLVSGMTLQRVGRRRR
jgi:hypothetical protein